MDTVSKILAHALEAANGSRKGIAITEKHARKALEAAMKSGFAFVFGATSMSSRAALLVFAVDGDVVRVAFADVSRESVAGRIDGSLTCLTDFGGLANVLPGFPCVSGEIMADTKMSPRPWYGGVSVVSLNLVPASASLVVAWMRAASPAFALPRAA